MGLITENVCTVKMYTLKAMQVTLGGGGGGGEASTKCIHLNECKFYMLKQQLNFYVPQKKEILPIWTTEKLFWVNF